MSTFRVIVSFYVDAADETAAEALVTRQLLIGDTTDAGDVHEGETTPWDFEG